MVLFQEAHDAIRWSDGALEWKINSSFVVARRRDLESDVKHKAAEKTYIMFLIILIIGKLDHTIGALQHKGTALALTRHIPSNVLRIFERTQCFKSPMANIFFLFKLV